MEALRNFVNGRWQQVPTSDLLNVINPATAQALIQVPLSPGEQVDAAVQAGSAAFIEWRRTPPNERVQPLYRLKRLMEEHLDQLAKTITNECGKTYKESVGELQRGIENIEVACGIPIL